MLLFTKDSLWKEVKVWKNSSQRKYKLKVQEKPKAKVQKEEAKSYN